MHVAWASIPVSYQRARTTALLLYNAGGLRSDLCFPPRRSSMPSIAAKAPPPVSTEAARPATVDIRRAHSTWHSTACASSPKNNKIRGVGRQARRMVRGVFYIAMTHDAYDAIDHREEKRKHIYNVLNDGRSPRNEHRSRAYGRRHPHHIEVVTVAVQ